MSLTRLFVLMVDTNHVALLSKSAESILESVIKRDPHEGEFIQAVQEVVHSLEAVLAKHPQYVRANFPANFTRFYYYF